MAEDDKAPQAAAEETPAPAPAEGGEAAEGEGADAAAAAKSKKKRLLLIASLAVAVLGIGVAVGLVFFGGHKSEKAADTAGPQVTIYDVPEFNLNLLSADPNTQHFLKIKLAVELANAKDEAAMPKLLPRLQDDWGGFLRQMRVGDLEGSANLERLKEGLLRRANQSLDPVAVKAVYIRELLVQ